MDSEWHDDTWLFRLGQKGVIRVERHIFFYEKMKKKKKAEPTIIVYLMCCLLPTDHIFRIISTVLPMSIKHCRCSNSPTKVLIWCYDRFVPFQGHSCACYPFIRPDEFKDIIWSRDFSFSQTTQSFIIWLINKHSRIQVCCMKQYPLRKHAYSNILKISPPKPESFQKKSSDIFHISAQNTDCEYSLEPPRRGGSNEYRQSMFLSRNKKNDVYPRKPQFYYIKVGFKGVEII